MNKWKYFTEKEVEGLEDKLVFYLDRARRFAQIPFVLTRTRDESDIGVKESAHHSGWAVDIRCSTSQDRWKIVYSLIAVGFCRIGVYDRHIHVDLDESKPQKVMWVGVSK